MVQMVRVLELERVRAQELVQELAEAVVIVVLDIDSLSSRFPHYHR